MPYDSRVHKRRSVRLPGFDYSGPGAYFITIVVHHRAFVFGEIAGGEMRLNDWGEIARDCWRAIPALFSAAGIDEFIIMPNHIHGIVVISDVDPVGATQWVAPTKTVSRADSGTRDGNGTLAPHSIGSMIGQFKSVTAKRINRSRGTPGVPLWQRNYYEHIIRNANELSRIRTYIRYNPIRWEMDVENG